MYACSKVYNYGINLLMYSKVYSYGTHVYKPLMYSLVYDYNINILMSS